MDDYIQCSKCGEVKPQKDMVKYKKSTTGFLASMVGSDPDIKIKYVCKACIDKYNKETKDKRGE